MILPKGFFEAFTETFAGRRFLLNLATGVQFGHLDIKSIDNHRVFSVWLKKIEELFPDLNNSNVDQCLDLFGFLVRKLGCGFSSPKNIYSSRADLKSLSRILDVDTIAFDPYSLLDPTRIDAKRLTSGPDDKFDDGLNHFIESLSGDASAIRAGATVRSGLPLSWAAPTDELAICESRQNAGCRADKIRNLLATPHYAGIHYLHRLDYPSEIGAAHGLHRPTLVEAGAQRYFRARTEESDECGRTVNLEHLGENIPNDVGVPEVLVPSVPMTADFRWQAIGRIEKNPPSCDIDAHEKTLYSSDLGSTLAFAIKILEEG